MVYFVERYIAMTWGRIQITDWNKILFTNQSTNPVCRIDVLRPAAQTTLITALITGRSAWKQKSIAWQDHIYRHDLNHYNTRSYDTIFGMGHFIQEGGGGGGGGGNGMHGRHFILFDMLLEQRSLRVLCSGCLALYHFSAHKNWSSHSPSSTCDPYVMLRQCMDTMRVCMGRSLAMNNWQTCAIFQLKVAYPASAAVSLCPVMFLSRFGPVWAARATVGIREPLKKDKEKQPLKQGRPLFIGKSYIFLSYSPSNILPYKPSCPYIAVI